MAIVLKQIKPIFDLNSHFGYFQSDILIKTIFFLLKQIDTN